MLRPYQLDAVEGLRDSWRLGNKRILLQLPTGAGKTVCASEIVKGAVSKGNRVLFVAHRRELIHQASDKLATYGVAHGKILAGEKPSPDDLVQVASIQTLQARAFRRSFLELPPAEVVIVDEAHRALADGYRKLANSYPNAAFLGLTATPVRGDGKGLGHLFEDMVLGPSISDLTDQGYLVPVRYFAPSMPDLYGIKTVAGDYNQNQLAERMDKPKLVGDVVANWLKICPDRKTVVFASSVEHSIHLSEQFNDAGINAAHLDGNTPLDERERILADIATGKIQVLCNCMVLTEGWDCPSISCCILARPTKSLGLYLQMAGRVLRPSDGKQDTYLIDHSGAVYMHGFLHEPFEWQLDSEGKIQDRETRRKEDKESKPITCQNCFTVYEGSRVCPSCGHAPQRQGRSVEQLEGTLGEVGKDKPKREEYTMDDKRQWYAMLKNIQQAKGYKDGWIAHTYKAKFGVWPKGLSDVQPLAPSIEVTRFVKHRLIRQAKARKPKATPLYESAR